MLLLFATGPTLTLDLQSAAVVGSSIGAGLVAAAKIIVNYLKEKDQKHSEDTKLRENFFLEERKRRDEDQKFIAAKFADTISRLEEKQDKSTQVLLSIQKETIVALGELTKSIHGNTKSNNTKNNSEK